MEQRNRFIAALMEPGQCQHEAEKAPPSGVYLLPVCAFGREMARVGAWSRDTRKQGR
jgi:hypothetical protein